MNGADVHFCTFQIRRLAGLAFFPATREAAEELRNTLMRAKNNCEAREIVDAWLESSGDTPTPHDLLELLWARRRQEEGLKYIGDPDCPECHGDGYRIRTVAGIDGAERCPCKANQAENSPAT